MADREPSVLSAAPAATPATSDDSDGGDSERSDTLVDDDSRGDTVSDTSRVETLVDDDDPLSRAETTVREDTQDRPLVDLTALPNIGTGEVPKTRNHQRPAGPTVHVAGYFRRQAGAVIDTLIILPVALLMTWIAGGLTSLELPASRNRGLDFWLDLLLAVDPALIGGLGLTIAIAAVYALVFQAIIGRTPGMRVVGVRVIDVYGDPPTTGRAIARTFGYLVSLATLGLGFLWIGFDSEKRGLHDWIAGTYVIKG